MRTIRHPIGYTLPILRDRLTKIVYDPDTDTSTPQPWDLNDPSVDHVQLVLTDDETEVLSAEMLIEPGVEGDISYAWQPSDVDTAARLVAIEQIHTVSGVQAAPAFIVEFYDPLVADEAESPLCQPWFDPATLTCPGETIPIDADAAQLACEFLYVASGYQYPGICTSTVRPCQPDYGCYDGGCWSCGPPYNVVKLLEPVIEVQDVSVDGVALDPLEYRVFDHRYLQRTVGGWPWQNLILPPGEPGTWTVTFTHGAAPPLGGSAGCAGPGLPDQ